MFDRVDEGHKGGVGWAQSQIEDESQEIRVILFTNTSLDKDTVMVTPENTDVASLAVPGSWRDVDFASGTDVPGLVRPKWFHHELLTKGFYLVLGMSLAKGRVSISICNLKNFIYKSTPIISV
jgi:hypothetical protein